jgi:hypothetical protein
MPPSAALGPDVAPEGLWGGRMADPSRGVRLALEGDIRGTAGKAILRSYLCRRSGADQTIEKGPYGRRRTMAKLSSAECKTIIRKVSTS